MREHRSERAGRNASGGGHRHRRHHRQPAWCRWREHAQPFGEDLLALVPQINARLKPVDLMAKDSSSLTLADMQRISDAVGTELDDPAVAGIVVLHGTDAMEESSLLVHLQRAITKPVVFTGAQFTADHKDADGPANLARAIETALDRTNAAKGVLLSFGGRCLPAWGFIS